MKTNAHREFTFTEKSFADEFQQYCEKELLTTKRFSDTEVSVAIYENEPETIEIADDKYYDIKIEMFIASVKVCMNDIPVVMCRDAERREGQLEGLEIARRQVNKVIAAYRSDDDITRFLRDINRFANDVPANPGSWSFTQGLIYVALQKKAALREILEDFDYADNGVSK